MGVVLKGHIAEDQFAAPLHIDLEGAVDHNFGNALVREQRLQWTKTENVGHDHIIETLALAAAEDQPGGDNRAAKDRLDNLPATLPVESSRVQLEIVD